jgi:hypothetical protein
MAEVVRDVEAGNLGPECAGAEMYPEPSLKATDLALKAFETEARGLVEPSDDEVFGAGGRVLSLTSGGRAWRSIAMSPLPPLTCGPP